MQLLEAVAKLRFNFEDVPS